MEPGILPQSISVEGQTGGAVVVVGSTVGAVVDGISVGITVGMTSVPDGEAILGLTVEISEGTTPVSETAVVAGAGEVAGGFTSHMKQSRSKK